MRAQNVSGLELPKPPQEKKKQGCTGCTAPKSNLRACRRQTKLFVAPNRDEIQKQKKRKWKEEREKIKQAKLNLAETKSVKAAKENDARKKNEPNLLAIPMRGGTKKKNWRRKGATKSRSMWAIDDDELVVTHTDSKSDE